MGITELFEIGFFTAFWNWSNPILTTLIYSFVIVGAILQIILQRKCRKSKTKWLQIAICGVAIVICECLWHAITGWDRLAIDIIYGLAICLLLVAIIATVTSFFMKGKK